MIVSLLGELQEIKVQTFLNIAIFFSEGLKIIHPVLIRMNPWIKHERK